MSNHLCNPTSKSLMLLNPAELHQHHRNALNCGVVKVKRCRQLKDADSIFQLVERCHGNIF